MRRLLGTAALVAAAYLLGTAEPSSRLRDSERDAGKGSSSGSSNRRRVWWWAMLLGGAAVAVATGGFLVAASGVIPIKASSGHWAITEWFLHFSMKRSVATHTLGMTVPPLDDAALVLKGAGHYETACRPCHGSPKLHHPRVAAAMTPPPPYLPPRIGEWDPEGLFYVVKHGVKFTGMPAWPTQKRDDEVWAMTAFLLAFRDMDGDEYRRLVYGRAGKADADAPIQGLLGPETAPEPVVENCGRCHGIDGHGRGTGAFPALAGQSVRYLESAMRAYASGERHSGIMEPVAAGLDAGEIREIARYYGGLAAEPTSTRASAEAIARGETIARRGLPSRKVPACVACHGPGDLRRNPAYPELAGQYADYLALQLELFKGRRRGGSEYAHLMHHVADGLTPEQMRAVAAYYGSLAPTPRSPVAP